MSLIFSNILFGSVIFPATLIGLKEFLPRIVRLACQPLGRLKLLNHFSAFDIQPFTINNIIISVRKSF